jgi:hypothetical protein
MVGLSNVDNTSDANKPVSTATQTALNAKAPLASPTFTGIVTIPSGASISGFAPLASPTFTGTVGGITAAMVGLGNVDNTSDANKPVSTATQTALNAKEPTITTLSVSRGGTGGTNASEARTNLGLGTAATTDSTAYATAAQGTKADSALQSSALSPYRTASAQDISSFFDALIFG